MTDSSTVAKIFLCQKLMSDNTYQFRFTVFRDDKETVFVKDRDERRFIEKVAAKLAQENIERYQKIQQVSRFSLSNNSIMAGGTDMRRVPDNIFQEVRKLLNDVAVRSEGQLQFVH